MKANRAKVYRGLMATIHEVEAAAFERGALAVIETVEAAISDGVPPLNAIAIVKGQLVEERLREGIETR
jgi:hypothetical protein